MVSTGLEQKLELLATEYLKPDAQFEDFRQYLQLVSEYFIEQFNQGIPIIDLLHGRSDAIDKLLIHLWQHFLGQSDHYQQLSLIAVGGFGRGELHPHSDIDLLILYPNKACGFEEKLQMFIACLWDSGLEIGHSVRSLKDSKQMAKKDITIATNLIESRVIAGDVSLFFKMKEQTATDKTWPGKRFFEAKYQEQRDRHLKFQKTSYSLEPNIKKSPGTLRDIQLVGWVAKGHFRVNSLKELVKLGFLTMTEFKTIAKCEAYLWRVRFALHIVAGRGEDRLLFDYQKPVAEMMGVSDGEFLTDVERLMKRYYRVVKSIRELNDMLLQHFYEIIIGKDHDHKVITLDEDFQIHGMQIEIRHDNVFRDNPSCLLKLFLHLADHPTLRGVRAPTLRRILIDRELINNDEFRSKEQNKKLFIQLFRHPNGIGKPFVLMKRYGVLKAYLPSFARILGQMQYDLFHIYTVDEHTLFVMDNLAKFSHPENEETFPLGAKVIKEIKKRDILFLGALFHDIGKGQGGDHSKIGADIAHTFCLQHKLTDEDAEFVSWLVKNHLLMSMTAQRKDITDPEVINQFAKIMKTTEHLQMLYLLTVADIRATSPSLWNNSKDSLLQNLYQLTLKALERGLENPKKEAEAITETKAQALKLLQKKRVPSNSIETLWSRFKDDYFIRNTVARIVWQTRKIIDLEGTSPIISHFNHRDSGAIEIFVYMAKHATYFTQITTLLYEKNLSIQDASLHSTIDHYILGSFVILEADGKPISSNRRILGIKDSLRDKLSNPDHHFDPLKRKTPHRYSHFDIKTSVNFFPSDNGQRTLLELVALDKPGLLARIGQAFLQLKVELHSAKVVTLGEKVEDVFSITNHREQPLESKEEQQQLRQLIIQSVEDEAQDNI
ncbi:MAG: [protein-PII] uridylyltransferase [Gammaproteobacteria bacterium]|nr:MAG: [protein-PII] uridylyltransferase [Gammaproteobacteria bacterium]